MPQILKPSDLAQRIAGGESLESIFGENGNWKAKLVGPQIQVETGDEKSRSITFIISTDAVDRYTDSVKLGGWRIGAYERNPVVLWAHDDQIPAIGRASSTRADKKALTSTAIFAERDVHPLADTIYRLLLGKFLHAASVGFVPLKFKPSSEPGRQFGLDILEQELLEWSVVNIPANPECLVLGRSAGIDTSPLYDWAERVLDGGGRITIPRTELEALRKAAKMPKPKLTRATSEWKVGASRDLPIGEDSTWDGPAAAARIFDAAGFGGENPDSAKARRGFLLYDSANAELKGSYKLPFADIVDGRLKAMPAGIRAAASRLPQTDVPQSEKDAARTVLDSYEEKIQAGSKSLRLMRGLCEVGQLAWLIDQLAWIENWVSVEADLEQDGSDIPARLTQALNALGLILVDMTKEEVAELIADEGTEVEEPMLMMADTPAQRIVLQFAAIAKRVLSTRYIITSNDPVGLQAAERIKAAWSDWWKRPTAPLVLDNGLKLTAISREGKLIDVTTEASEPITATVQRRLEQLVRAGRVLSAKNEADLKEAAALIEGVLEQVGNQDKDGAQARARKARATRLKLAPPA